MHGQQNIKEKKWLFTFKEIIYIRSENCKKMQRFLTIKRMLYVLR